MQTKAKKVKRVARKKRTHTGMLARAADHLEQLSMKATAAHIKIAGAMPQDDGAYAAKVVAVVGVVSVLLRERAPQTFKKLRLNGVMDDDYRFTAGDFPLFVNLVAEHLEQGLPPYVMSVADRAKVAAENLSSTGVRLCSAIEENSKP